MSKITYSLTDKDLLLVTDIQVDFLPGGALPVEGGDEIIPVINHYIRHFDNEKSHVIASRDWHPPNHISFKAQGGPWPPHCVQGTSGAQFSPDLKLPLGTTIVSKATDPKHEAYSAFDNTDLADNLRKLGIERLFVAGLATDYCVVNTVLDACKLGFDAIVLMDAILGINAKPGDVDRAIETMIKNGATQATEDDFPEMENALPIEETVDDRLAEKPSMIDAAKKKAKTRSKSVNKRIKTERKS